MASTRSSLTATLLKFYVVSVLLSSWLVAAQNIPFLPSCAKGCAADAVKSSGCSASDAVCQCKDTTSGGLGFVNSIDRCAPFAGCSTEDQSATYGAVHVYCDSALSSTTSSTGSSTSSTTKGSSTTSSGSTKPTTSSGSSSSNTGTTTTDKTTAGTTTPAVAVTITTTAPGGTSTGVFTTLSLPSLSSTSSGVGTSVVLQTVTSIPNGNAALGMRAVMDGPFAVMLAVSTLGMVLGTFAAL